MADEAVVTQLSSQYLVEGEAALSITQLASQYLVQRQDVSIVVTQLASQYLVLAIIVPAIAVEATSYRRAEITLTTPGEEATSHSLHRSTVSGFTAGPGNLIVSGLGALGFSYEDEGLAGGTTYYYRAVAQTPAGELVSQQAAVTTPAQLLLLLEELAGAQLRHGEDAVAVQIQYQTTLASDPTFAAPVHDVVQTGSSRYLYAVTGRPANTAHLSRARTRTGAAAAWEPWSASVPWTTLAEAPAAQSAGAFTFPPFAYPQRGAAAVFTWSAGETVTGVEISDDFGQTWDAVPGWDQEGVLLDTTGFADGAYVLRVLRESGCHLYHGGFLIDNAEAATYIDDFLVDISGVGRPAMAKYWNPLPRYMLWNTQTFAPGATGHIGVPGPLSSFGPIEPPELTACRGVVFMGEGLIAGTGAGFQWDRCHAGEVADVGLVVLGAGTTPGDPGGDARAVKCGIKHFLLSAALGPAPGDDPFRFTGVAGAITGETEFEVAVGPVSVQPAGGWHVWREPCTAGMSWTQMTLGSGSAGKAGPRMRPYQFILEVTRPDPGGTPHRLHIRARVDAPDAWSCSGRRQILVDQTVDVLDDDGQPYVFEPGHLAFFTQKTPGNRASDSGRFLTRLSALLLEEVPAPEPPEPDTPQLQITACDLLLEVFDDDRETVLWAAGTSRSHEHPYLVLPDKYAEQEIDVATGAATIGTVTVTVIDKAQTAGDQDSGWMTARLARFGLANLHGRRARLTRFVDVPEGLIPNVVIDGVAGEARMDASYAAFGFDIRDTREIERKIRLTDTGNPTTLLPHGVLDGYGYNAAEDTWLIDPATPLLGRFLLAYNDAAFHLAGNTGAVKLFTDPGNPDADRTIADVIYQAMQGATVVTESGTFDDYRVSFQGLAVLWRAAGSGDPWTEIGTSLVIDGEYHPGFDALPGNLVLVRTLVPGTGVRAESIAFGDSRAVPQIPADNQEIELVIVSRRAASADLPLYLEGLTAGELARNVYDGLYSPRDADGLVVPTGIRYDEAALLQMLDPVRLRLTESVTDARTWLEKVVYAPTGWVPALDEFGRISPVSQVPPTDIDTLPLVSNLVTEPSPDWGSGRRIINIIRFTYARDYLPEDTDVEVATDGLATIPITVEFRDEPSIVRHGEQILELDGSAFRAVGEPDGAAIGGLTGDETAYQLALLRQLYVLNRYSLGAPSFTDNVRRSATPAVRAGSWVRVSLSWLPDYVTEKRGLIALCQVMANNDLDCVWRRLTMEVAAPLDLGS